MGGRLYLSSGPFGLERGTVAGGTGLPRLYERLARKSSRRKWERYVGVGRYGIPVKSHTTAGDGEGFTFFKTAIHSILERNNAYNVYL